MHILNEPIPLFSFQLTRSIEMFKKSGPPQDADRLANRLRKIAERPASEEPEHLEAENTDNRASREPTFKQAAIMLTGGERVEVVVKNVSETGMRIEFFRKVTLTDQVIIIEPTLSVRKWAQVIWQEEGAAGLKFVE